MLKTTGTCWINIGDTYASGGGQATEQSWIRENGGTRGHPDNPAKAKLRKTMGKSLLQIPSRFAIEMSDRGWILRNEIIWYKRNCMPASVTDRFTIDFEKIFFSTKNKDYYFQQQFDAKIYPNDKVKDLCKEIYTKAKTERSQKPLVYSGAKIENEKNIQAYGLQQFQVAIRFIGKQTLIEHPELTKEEREYIQDFLHDAGGNPEGRNMRTVWAINTKSSASEHYASFPESLVEICINAGCPPDGIVLDPFLGSGTTAIVAQKLGRKWLGCEIVPKYVDIATRRLGGKLTSYLKEEKKEEVIA